jgi:HSP20 family protein
MFYDVFGPSWGSELREMQRLFDDFGRFGSRSRRPGDGTALNVWANDESVAVTAELPGIAPESLNLSIVGDTLTLSGSRQAVDGQAKDVVWHRRERPSFEFTRTIQLPFKVDPDQTEARVEDGVLMVALRRVEADKPRRISVNAA